MGTLGRTANLQSACSATCLISRINKKKAKIMPVGVVKKSLHQSPKVFLRTRVRNNNSNNYNSSSSNNNNNKSKSNNSNNLSNLMNHKMRKVFNMKMGISFQPLSTTTESIHQPRREWQISPRDSKPPKLKLKEWLTLLNK